MHDYGFGLSLIFFGVVCLIFGHLIRKSRFLPVLIGTLMQIAGACYLVNSFALLSRLSLARVSVSCDPAAAVHRRIGAVPVAAV